MPEDFDFGKVAFIVIAMIAAFVQWVWKSIQESKERQKSQQEDDSEPRTLREMTSQKQTPPMRRATSETRSAPNVPSAPSVSPTNLWDAFEHIKQEMRKAQEQAEPVPPPLPVSPRRVTPPAMSRAVQSPPPAPLVKQPAQVVARVEPAVSSRDDFASLRGLLMNPQALRNAVLLREILGPPKALQSSSELTL